MSLASDLLRVTGGGDTKALTRRLESILFSCQRKMIRDMAKVIWRNHASSFEVVSRCGMRELGVLMRLRRLRWFGHMERRDETEILWKTQRSEVPGRRPPGRPRKI